MTRPTVIHASTVAALLAIAASIACGAPSSQPAPAAAPATPASPQVSKKPSAPAPGDPVWHYEGAQGPEHWGSLSPKFATCQAGRSQSPIDITAVRRVEGIDRLSLKFPSAQLRILHHEHVSDAINNGHTIQVNYSEGDTLTIGGASYQLAQYHFHAPSEHTVDGEHFPMEMHLVHKSADGKLAVIGVLLAEGAANDAFNPIWSNLPAEKGVEHHFASVKVDVDALLPPTRSTYRYDGSLTTPPCSEAVKWLVMTTPITLSSTQIGAFTGIIRGNNRPVQPLNGREIVSDTVGALR